MKYTVVGDPHLKHKNINEMQVVCARVEKLGNKTVWTGDLLDTKEIVRGKCLNFWYDYFDNSPLEHIVLVGNHDWFNLECEDHSLRILENLANVVVVDNLVKPVATGEPYHLPYVHDIEKLRAMLAEIPDNEVVFGHFEIKDFDFGSGKICETGLTFEDFARFKKVFSGHFHKFQERGNLIYVGTPFSHSFGETDQEKNIFIYDFAEDSYEKVDLGLPKHVTGEINCDESGELMFPNTPNVDLAQDHIRVLLKGSRESINKFDRSPWRDFDIKWREVPTDEVVVGAQLNDMHDNTTQFANFAKDIKGWDKETTKLGAQILEAVNVG